MKIIPLGSLVQLLQISLLYEFSHYSSNNLQPIIEGCKPVKIEEKLWCVLEKTWEGQI
jgi:hypothetical protein